MRGLAKILIGIAVVAALAMAFAWGFGQWWKLPVAPMREIYLVYACAAVIAVALFGAGHVLKITSHAYYLIIGGAIFLAVDFLVWQRTGIMPSARFLRGGFLPAAIMGMFAGVLYRVIAVSVPPQPDHR